MKNSLAERKRVFSCNSSSNFEFKLCSERMKQLSHLKLPYILESSIKVDKNDTLSIIEANQLTSLEKELESGTLSEKNKMDFIYNILDLTEQFFLLGLVNGNLKLSNILIDKNGKLCINDCFLNELQCKYEKCIHFNCLETLIIVIYQILEGCNLFCNKSIYEIAKFNISLLKPSTKYLEIESLILSNNQNKLFEELQIELSRTYDDWKYKSTMIDLFKDNNFYYKYYHIFDPYTSIYIIINL